MCPWLLPHCGLCTTALSKRRGTGHAGRCMLSSVRPQHSRLLCCLLSLARLQSWRETCHPRGWMLSTVCSQHSRLLCCLLSLASLQSWRETCHPRGWMLSRVRPYHSWTRLLRCIVSATCLSTWTDTCCAGRWMLPPVCSQLFYRLMRKTTLSGRRGAHHTRGAMLPSVSTSMRDQRTNVQYLCICMSRYLWWYWPENLPSRLCRRMYMSPRSGDWQCE